MRRKLLAVIIALTIVFSQSAIVYAGPAGAGPMPASASIFEPEVIPIICQDDQGEDDNCQGNLSRPRPGNQNSQ